ncbi:hypothetical protein [Campylobacter ureolyticus]|jgi:hypothetical protein|uniref:Uncharacterized protein n=1 Tax=Campylobacter ureolyticus TaxID=827 RepID=A0A9Q4KGA2_9BACT|nr:hypothetical protein [Campylobacter ureolyticus]MCZ6159123.1 hypothetical protein [Campylobacter ureolyticus]MCZ6162928.1 hypothetical protein [Campylobacter ureolyticus]MCZ6164579.1 hypothetical protein [Campylobacter ureolyticus]
MCNTDKMIFNSIIECPYCGYIRTTKNTKMNILVNKCCDFWQETDTETFAYTCQKCGKEFDCDIKLKTKTIHFVTVNNIKKKDNK